MSLIELTGIDFSFGGSAILSKYLPSSPGISSPTTISIGQWQDSKAASSTGCSSSTDWQEPVRKEISKRLVDYPESWKR